MWYNVEHGAMHKQWHFIYFGYSRQLKKTYFYIKWLQGEFEKATPEINHYIVNQHYFILGKDIFGHNWYSGMYAFVTLHYGPGAYHERPFGIKDQQKIQLAKLKGEEMLKPKEKGKEGKDKEEKEPELPEIPDTFHYEAGKAKYHPGFDLSSHDSEEEALLPSAFN